MRGTEEQEACRGVVDKYELLNTIHQILKPQLYLEIGIQKGRSLNCCHCDCIGVDPSPRLSKYKNGKWKSPCSIFAMSSDEFFDEFAYNEFQDRRPDLVFIDGLHLFENALRDFINVEKWSHPGTVVVLDDIFPAHPDQALRKRITCKWTGDVWKVIEILTDLRSDLKISFLDATPTGMAIIQGLDSKNTKLTEYYVSLLEQYLPEIPVPTEVVERKAVLNHPIQVIKEVLR